MKWTTLLEDFKDRVGLTQQPSPPSASSSASSPSSRGANSNPNASPALSPTSRDRHELELDFKRSWEEFRQSSSEKEKEVALNFCVDIFCRLVKQHANVAQLVTKNFEVMVVALQSKRLKVVPIDKQSLLDSGIYCCLVHILNALLDPDITLQQSNAAIDHEEPLVLQKGYNGDVGQVHRLEIEGSVAHIMKALASHPSAAESLVEDDSLLLLFQMLSNGSMIVFSRYKEGLVPLHSIQLH